MAETRILIVDDEATIRALLKCAVAAPGMTLFEADCAERALDAARGNAPFDLVITDVLMPGMDGVDLATHLRAGGYAARFLFISGYCDMQSLEGRLNGLNARFLAKPFNVPELIRIVHILLDERRSGNAPRPRRQASQ